MEQRLVDERISMVFSREIQRLVDEIAWVDRRLYELEGDESEEARVEVILLRTLRDHLVSDLKELGGFGGGLEWEKVPSISSVGVDGREDALGYS